MTDRREVKNGRIPPRTTWWMSSVEGFEDDQMSNRFLLSDIDDSHEHDLRVLERKKKLEVGCYTRSDTNEAIQICRCIFCILDLEDYRVVIPYAEGIEWNNPENRRNFDKFKDIIRSVTVYNVFQREKMNG